MRDPTIQKFLEETALDPHVAGKRLRSLSWPVPAVSHQKRQAKSLGGGKLRPVGPGVGTDTGGPGESAGPSAAADATPRAAQRSSLFSTSCLPAAGARPVARVSSLCADAKCGRGRGRSGYERRGHGRGFGPSAAAGVDGVTASPQGPSSRLERNATAGVAAPERGRGRGDSQGTAAMPHEAAPDSAAAGGSTQGRGRGHGCSPAAAAGPHAGSDSPASASAVTGSGTLGCCSGRSNTTPRAAPASPMQQQPQARGTDPPNCLPTPLPA